VKLVTSLDDGKTKGVVWKLVGIAANAAKSGSPLSDQLEGAKKTARSAKVHSGLRNSSSTGDALIWQAGCNLLTKQVATCLQSWLGKQIATFLTSRQACAVNLASRCYLLAKWAWQAGKHAQLT
jgi:hypothetical protein